MKTLIIRHSKERISKCSLRLISHPCIHFVTYPQLEGVPWYEYTQLAFTGPLLEASKACSLLLLDGTWRLAERMAQHPRIRSLECVRLDERWRTAYPRRQTACADPQRGLSSIEALYAAWLQMGQESEQLLQHYYWKEDFLNRNAECIAFWRAQKA